VRYDGKSAVEGFVAFADVPALPEAWPRSRQRPRHPLRAPTVLEMGLFGECGSLTSFLPTVSASADADRPHYDDAFVAPLFDSSSAVLRSAGKFAAMGLRGTNPSRFAVGRQPITPRATSSNSSPASFCKPVKRGQVQYSANDRLRKMPASRPNGYRSFAAVGRASRRLALQSFLTRAAVPETGRGIGR